MFIQNILEYLVFYHQFALLLISKQLSSLSLRGACNSFIRDDEIISYIERGGFNKLGIITIYKIFSGRTICQQYPNYAKQLTKDYFNYIITQLNSPLLYLYLISNAIILNYELSVTAALDDFNKLPNENIKQYSERVKDEIDAYIYDIKETIDNL